MLKTLFVLKQTTFFNTGFIMFIMYSCVIVTNAHRCTETRGQVPNALAEWMQLLFDQRPRRRKSNLSTRFPYNFYSKGLPRLPDLSATFFLW